MGNCARCDGEVRIALNDPDAECGMQEALDHYHETGHLPACPHRDNPLMRKLTDEDFRERFGYYPKDKPVQPSAPDPDLRPEAVERVADYLALQAFAYKNAARHAEAAALLRALRARLTREHGAGYILAMRLLQSDLFIEDDERAAIELFLPQYEAPDDA